MKPRARRSTTVHSVSPRAAPARAAVGSAGAVTPQWLPEVALQSARVPASEFKRRRARLMSMMEPGSVAILPSATNLIRNRDTEYPFRQDSDFHYLYTPASFSTCLLYDRVGFAISFGGPLRRSIRLARHPPGRDR